MPAMNPMYLIDGVAIRPEHIDTIEYMKYSPAAAGQRALWVRCATLEEFNKTPEDKRAIKINDIVCERPKDIFLVDLAVLMNAQAYIADKKAGRLDVSTGTPAAVPAAPPAAAPLIPGMTNP